MVVNNYSKMVCAMFQTEYTIITTRTFCNFPNNIQFNGMVWLPNNEKMLNNKFPFNNTQQSSDVTLFYYKMLYYMSKLSRNYAFVQY